MKIVMAEADVQPMIKITLSERNLLALLSKLYTPGSAATIGSNFIVDGIPDPFREVLVEAEADDKHYDDPERKGAGPGPMHPVTERILAAIKLTIDSKKLTVWESDA